MLGFGAAVCWIPTWCAIRPNYPPAKPGALFWSRSKRLTHVAPAKRPFHSVECSTPHELLNRCSLGNLQFPVIALT